MRTALDQVRRSRSRRAKRVKRDRSAAIFNAFLTVITVVAFLCAFLVACVLARALLESAGLAPRFVCGGFVE